MLMLCTPNNHEWPIFIYTKMDDFEYFLFSQFSHEKIDINSEKCIGYGI